MPPTGGMSMSRELRVGLLPLLPIVTALLLAGCSGSISGQVLSATEGEPVSGVTVSADGTSHTTGPDGTYTLPEVATGSQLVSLEKAGFPPQTIEVDVQRGANTADLNLADAFLEGRIREIAVKPRRIRRATIAVDDRRTESDSTGYFRMNQLAPGPHSATITAANHEPLDKNIELSAGPNEVDFKLPLTAVGTAKRYVSEIRYGRPSEAYRYVNPDVRQVLRQSEWYAREGQLGADMLSYRIAGSRAIGTWTSPDTKKSYSSVREVRRSAVWMVRIGAPNTWVERRVDHWVQVKGVWYWLGTREGIF